MHNPDNKNTSEKSVLGPEEAALLNHLQGQFSDDPETLDKLLKAISSFKGPLDEVNVKLAGMAGIDRSTIEANRESAGIPGSAIFNMLKRSLLLIPVYGPLIVVCLEMAEGLIDAFLILSSMAEGREKRRGRGSRGGSAIIDPGHPLPPLEDVIMNILRGIDLDKLRKDAEERQIEVYRNGTDSGKRVGGNPLQPETLDPVRMIGEHDAEIANAAAKESPGYAQAATRDKLLGDREHRERFAQERQQMPQSVRKRLEQRQRSKDLHEAEREDALNKAEIPPENTAQPANTPLVPNIPAPLELRPETGAMSGNEEALTSTSTSYPPRLDAEYIDPAAHWRNVRNSPPLELNFTHLRDRSSYVPTAAWAAMAAQSATASGAGAEGVKVVINHILPPPTHLADEDFRRCMQREIDQIVETFDTGVRG